MRDEGLSLSDLVLPAVAISLGATVWFFTGDQLSRWGTVGLASWLMVGCLFELKSPEQVA